MTITQVTIDLRPSCHFGRERNIKKLGEGVIHIFQMQQWNSKVWPCETSLHDLPDFFTFGVEQTEGGDVGAAIFEVVQVDHMKVEASDEVVVVRGHHHFLWEYWHVREKIGQENISLGIHQWLNWIPQSYAKRPMCNIFLFNRWKMELTLRPSPL